MNRWTGLVMSTLLACGTTLVSAQPPGHGGVPPGQAKKMDNRNDNRGRDQDRFDNSRRLPPGQAKKFFREEDRSRFYARYRVDADRWRGRKRPVFIPGQVIARNYVIQPVPRSYWVGQPPPPPGYQYGYYEGYVVEYNPTTRVIGDVLDLVGVALGH